MVEVKDLIKEADKNNIGITKQAQTMLMSSDNPLNNIKTLIGYAKEKRMKIAGGDVLRFILQKKIPTSIWTSDDNDEIEARLIRMEQMLIDIKATVK